MAGRAILGRVLDRYRARSASRLVSPTRVVASSSTTPARTAAAAGAACAYAAVGRRCAGCTPAREASRSTPTGGRVCSASPTLPTLNHTSHTPSYPGPSDRRSFGAGLRLLAAFLTLRSPASVLPRSTSVPHYLTKGFLPRSTAETFSIESSGWRSGTRRSLRMRGGGKGARVRTTLPASAAQDCNGYRTQRR